jgi:branched-subunit amino acid aminotransferase/4-amino-4-deoxychorismate lyase
MHRFAFFNRQIILASDAMLFAISSAAFYGKGVFTTIAIKNKEPFLWEKHWRRLKDNAGKIGVDFSEFAEKTVKNALAELIEKNQTKNARARITFFDESASKIWQFNTNRKTSLLITIADLRKMPEVFRLTISPFSINSTSPLAGVKSCNYLENILALEEAQRRGFTEAVRVNERGEIVGACMANIFWLKDGKLFTPSLKTGCLAGATREFVLENRECFEVEEKAGILREADAIFLTSSGIGVAQVAEFEEKKLAANYTNDFSSFIRYIRG